MVKTNFTKPETTYCVVLSNADIPEGILLTNRLDKMTLEQGRWAILNELAWLVYLQDNDAEIHQHSRIDAKAASEPSDMEKQQVILEILQRVEAEVVDEDDNVKLEHLNNWIDTLNWILKHLPIVYSKIHQILSAELSRSQYLRSPSKKR